MQKQVRQYQQIIKTGLENMNCIVPPGETTGGLYLGDIISTKKSQLLQKYQIHSILSCSLESKPTIDKIDIKFIPALDHVQYDIKQHFQQTYDYIQRKLKQKNNVLVHCHAGISRSATIVIAFLMKNKSISFTEAFSLVKNKRPRIKPNQAFVQQLMEFQNELKSNKRIAQNDQKSQHSVKPIETQEDKTKIQQKQYNLKIIKQKQISRQSDIKNQVNNTNEKQNSQRPYFKTTSNAFFKIKQQIEKVENKQQIRPISVVNQQKPFISNRFYQPFQQQRVLQQFTLRSPRQHDFSQRQPSFLKNQPSIFHPTYYPQRIYHQNKTPSTVLVQNQIKQTHKPIIKPLMPINITNTPSSIIQIKSPQSTKNRGIQLTKASQNRNTQRITH